ncbi:hypothetical protein HPB50_022356 [Hyalomma asiaticum]|uniref:Uncharacterized protein n=1 Tax=Hyalomma asiaticum TaxID=266040 RepID=A0ACB7S510_HYAAI|nr:hypothetical protein HPB50_022356 [Hyalomma asiaticum]
MHARLLSVSDALRVRRRRTELFAVVRSTAAVRILHPRLPASGQQAEILLPRETHGAVARVLDEHATDDGSTPTRSGTATPPRAVFPRVERQAAEATPARIRMADKKAAAAAAREGWRGTTTAGPRDAAGGGTTKTPSLPRRANVGGGKGGTLRSDLRHRGETRGTPAAAFAERQLQGQRGGKARPPSLEKKKTPDHRGV